MTVGKGKKKKTEQQIRGCCSNASPGKTVFSSHVSYLLANVPSVISAGCCAASTTVNRDRGTGPPRLLRTASQFCTSLGSAGNHHVLSVGIHPAPAVARKAIQSNGPVLNIGRVAEAAEVDASIICPRGTACPRPQRCAELPAPPRTAEIADIREQIIQDATAG